MFIAPRRSTPSLSRAIAHTTRGLASSSSCWQLLQRRCASNRSIYYGRYPRVGNSTPTDATATADAPPKWDRPDPREVVQRRGRLWDWNSRKALHERMIRVDHAGELGAIRICQGQMLVLGNDPVVREIYDEELVHYSRFQHLVAEHRVRPTVMHPIWSVAGIALGAATALLGRPAAMACHKAVEEVIAEHYNDQIRAIYNRRHTADAPDAAHSHDADALLDRQERYQREHFVSAATEMRDREEVATDADGANAGRTVQEQDDRDERKLRETFVRFRDDEMHHHDLAVENDAHKAPVYNVLYNLIKTGCRTAIWISSRF